MDAQQALADLTEISSQVAAAAIFSADGTIAASTLDQRRTEELVRGASELLDRATTASGGATPPVQLEAATNEGSVFAVRDGNTLIAATTGPQPTVGLVFYDLKSALRQLETKPAAKRRSAPRKKKDTAATAEAKPARAPRRKPAPKKPKPDAP
jgi:predicted regulator of Ras-like GTPase activity (Roadblock/LC7/MglB family)